MASQTNSLEKHTVTTELTSSDDDFLLQRVEQIYHLQNNTLNMVVSQHTLYVIQALQVTF